MLENCINSQPPLIGAHITHVLIHNFFTWSREKHESCIVFLNIKMPQYSKHMLFLCRSKELLKKRQRLKYLRFFLDMEDEFHDDMDSVASMQFKRHSKARYLFRSWYRSRDAKRTNKVDKTLHAEKFTPTEPGSILGNSRAH